jgi:hypothetical protein
VSEQAIAGSSVLLPATVDHTAARRRFAMPAFKHSAVLVARLVLLVAILFVMLTGVRPGYDAFGWLVWGPGAPLEPQHRRRALVEAADPSCSRSPTRSRAPARCGSGWSRRWPAPCSPAGSPPRSSPTAPELRPNPHNHQQRMKHDAVGTECRVRARFEIAHKADLRGETAGSLDSRRHRARPINREHGALTRFFRVIKPAFSPARFTAGPIHRTKRDQH